MDVIEGEIGAAVPDPKAAADTPGSPSDLIQQALACKSTGNALFKSGKYREAIIEYGRAMALCPGEPSYVANRGAAFLMLGEYADALRDSLAAIDADPGFTKAYVRALKCHIALGQLDQVDGLVNRGLDARISSNFDVQEEVVRSRRLRRSLRQCSEAVANGKAASELPRLQLLQKEMPGCAQVQVLLVEAFLARSKNDDAIALCSTFLRQHPTNMQLQYQRAMAFYRLGRFDQAVSRLQESLRHDPDNKRCVSLFKTIKRLIKAKELGNLSFKAGRLQEAYQRYTDALAIDPHATHFNSVLLCNRAAVAIKLRRFSEAIADCDACLEIDTGNVKALCRRATAYLETELYEEAVRDLENAKKRSGADRDVCDQLRQAQIELAKSKRKNHYKTLGVDKDCHESDIKKAYRRLALQYHPDKNHGCNDADKAAAEAKFKDICEAYEILSDPQKRRRFDSGADMDMNGHHHGGHPMDMNDVFQMFFQQGGAGGGPGFGHFTPGASHHFSF